MKKLILLTLFITPLLSATPVTNVYICTGKYSKVYHKTKDCKGIKSCRSEVKVITFSEVKNIKRTPCKLCYK